MAEKILNLVDYSTFIKTVVDYVIGYDKTNGDILYSPELLFPTIQYCTATYYDDFEETGDENADYEAYITAKRPTTAQYESMIKAIEEKIEFEKNKLIFRKQDSLTELLGTVNKKVDEIDMKAVNKSIKQFLPKVKNFDLNKLFKGVIEEKTDQMHDARNVLSIKKE